MREGLCSFDLSTSFDLFVEFVDVRLKAVDAMDGRFKFDYGSNTVDPGDQYEGTAPAEKPGVPEWKLVVPEGAVQDQRLSTRDERNRDVCGGAGENLDAGPLQQDVVPMDLEQTGQRAGRRLLGMAGDRLLVVYRWWWRRPCHLSEKDSPHNKKRERKPWHFSVPSEW